ncbi:NAD(P)H-binding protein [Dyadobacter psychrotolerans]|uniref:NAD-dependent dehydratase n=1 Tax=Dyadobacter psychrotolerans TaxID=2541721 RepID=A0A4R5DMJ0_9BACT|nr:NAD(P)H-binding protein [Dyadobacter psychrotolerans]TDE12115.1 NAD-dependent dehydratase [Dyadobacter psychrotolerans]
MKYIITGSLGHISLPVVKNLISAGHEVTVISSSESKKVEIESLGAKAAIGSVHDLDFLKNAFAGADAVYLMVPSDFSIADYPKFQREIGDRYVEAVSAAKIKNVVLLSSIGAHMKTGAGPIDGLAYLEDKLREVENINVNALRPSYFFYNLYSQAGLIKNAGITGSNFGDTDEKLILTDTGDIAKVATAELLALSFTGFNITYIASDERRPTEIAEVLGVAVDKPGIPWITFTDEQSTEGMLQAGLSPVFAKLYTDMGKAIREGKLQEDYWKNRPQVLGEYKLEDFAREFAVAYNI